MVRTDEEGSGEELESTSRQRLKKRQNETKRNETKRKKMCMYETDVDIVSGMTVLVVPFMLQLWLVWNSTASRIDPGRLYVYVYTCVCVSWKI